MTFHQVPGWSEWSFWGIVCSPALLPASPRCSLGLYLPKMCLRKPVHFYFYFLQVNKANLCFQRGFPFVFRGASLQEKWLALVEPSTEILCGSPQKQIFLHSVGLSPGWIFTGVHLLILLCFYGGIFNPSYFVGENTLFFWWVKKRKLMSWTLNWSSCVGCVTCCG